MHYYILGGVHIRISMFFHILYQILVAFIWVLAILLVSLLKIKSTTTVFWVVGPLVAGCSMSISHERVLIYSGFILVTFQKKIHCICTFYCWLMMIRGNLKLRVSRLSTNPRDKQTKQPYKTCHVEANLPKQLLNDGMYYWCFQKNRSV